MSAFKEKADFMQHPYWNELLRIPHLGENTFLARITSANRNAQERFLRLVAEGFYPISYSSPLAFRRVAQLTDSPAVQETANYIYEVELGRHPFIKGNKYQGILHCIQFKNTLASLLDDYDMALPHPEKYPLIERLDLAHAPMLKALAVCSEIEHQAPEIIVCFQDFVAQWQYLTHRSSRSIDRIYLDEHGLTEGSDEEEQHIEMVERMTAPYRALLETEAYAEAQNEYNRLCLAHVDETYNSIMSLMRELPEPEAALP